MRTLGVFGPPVLKIPIKTRLVNSGYRRKTHRNGWKFPEIRHQPGMGVGRKTSPFFQFPSEVFHLGLSNPVFQKSPGINTWRGVALKVNLIPIKILSPGSKEMVKTYFKQVCGRGIGRNVAADARILFIGPNNHSHGIPAYDTFNAPLNGPITGIWRLLLNGNCI